MYKDLLPSEQNRATTITVPALYVKGGKTLNRANICVILDSDQDISRLYPLDEDCEPHLQSSIEFISEPGLDTDLCYLHRRNGLDNFRQVDWLEPLAPQIGS